MRAVALMLLAISASGCATGRAWQARGVVPGRGVASEQDVQAIRNGLAEARAAIRDQGAAHELLAERVSALEQQVQQLSQRPQAVQTPPEHLYEVHRGDTLWSIAKEIWGDPYKWVRLYDANRDRVDDPDRIYPGQLLRVPPEPNVEPASR